MNEETERCLIARFRTGDTGAYGELFDEHHRRILHWALQIVRNEEAALDVAQEVFLRAFEELPYWRAEARISSWLHRTALNVCFEFLRADERQRRYGEQPADSCAAASPESLVLQKEILSAIDNAVRSLPPRQRAVFALKQYEDLGFSEIAPLLDITANGAKASYYRAILALRERLHRFAP
ncbi:MAG: RNA polymerase sigma factor [Planctomycetota bacterium]